MFFQSQVGEKATYHPRNPRNPVTTWLVTIANNPSPTTKLKSDSVGTRLCWVSTSQQDIMIPIAQVKVQQWLRQARDTNTSLRLRLQCWPCSTVVDVFQSLQAHCWYFSVNIERGTPHDTPWHPVTSLDTVPSTNRWLSANNELRPTTRLQASRNYGRISQQDIRAQQPYI